MAQLSTSPPDVSSQAERLEIKVPVKRGWGTRL
jgi:hypothetical protein